MRTMTLMTRGGRCLECHLNLLMTTDPCNCFYSMAVTHNPFNGAYLWEEMLIPVCTFCFYVCIYFRL